MRYIIVSAINFPLPEWWNCRTMLDGVEGPEEVRRGSRGLEDLGAVAF